MRFMFFPVACALVFASPALAQEQRGSIEGTVKDTSGAVLPGVTVEAASPALVGTAVAITGADGLYRFPSLRPGTYAITARLASFATAQTPNVKLELGQVLKVDLTLAPGGVSERIDVTGEVPLIDVKQSAAFASVAAELIERIPKTRDFTLLVTSVPGVTNEGRNRGIQIDGGSGADNRFIVDGVDTTNLANGTSGRSVAPDFIQEVQVKASGYSAEYRASLGGVISAITKTGSNRLHAMVGAYHNTDNMVSSPNATLRLNPANQTQVESITVPRDDFNNWEPVMDIGGPIRTNRLWFYAGYNPQFQKTTRSVRFTTGNPDNVTSTFTSEPAEHTVNYNLTGQVTDNIRARFTGVNTRSRGGLALPNIEPNGTSTSNPTQFPAPTRTDGYNDTQSGIVDWVASNSTYVNVTASHFRYGTRGEGTFSNQLRHVFVGPNLVFPEIPPPLRGINGFSDFPSSNRTAKNEQARISFSSDVTKYVSWRGSHTLKAGFQFERMIDHLATGAQAPTISLNWNASRATNDGRFVRGTYGYFNLNQQFSLSDVEANNLGLFLQDSWTLPRHNLTLNLGLRTEREEVPSYRDQNPGVEFGFGDKIAPRIGFAWDVRGDNTWKAYGSWGVFYDLMKLTVGRVMFGGDRWDNYYFTLDSFDWPSITCSLPATQGGTPTCPGGTFIEYFDFRPPANLPGQSLIDPDLKPARSQEFTLGMDHELTRTISVSARYAHKWVDYAIEAVCTLAPSGEACGVNNPGFGTAVQPFGPNFPVQPPAERLYDGIEFRLRKRLANRWSMDASYLFSDLRGNWSGIASSDEAVGSLQPNSGRAFDLLYYSFKADGTLSNGVLATDRPHQLKVQATYDLPFGTMVGTNILAESGLPHSTVINQKNIGFFPYGRGDLGRSEVFSQVDLLLQQTVRLRGIRGSIGLNVSNLFDQRQVNTFNVNPYRDGFVVDDAVFFAGFDPAAYAAANPAIRANPLFKQGSLTGNRSLRLEFRVSY